MFLRRKNMEKFDFLRAAGISKQIDTLKKRIAELELSPVLDHPAGQLALANAKNVLADLYQQYDNCFFK